MVVSIKKTNFDILQMIWFFLNLINRYSIIFFREQFTQEFKHDDGHDFDENGGQWHLLIAIRPDGPQGVAYHPQCYSDKGNYFS